MERNPNESITGKRDKPLAYKSNEDGQVLPVYKPLKKDAKLSHLGATNPEKRMFCYTNGFKE